MDNNVQELHPIARLTSFLTTLSPSSIARLGDIYAANIHFLDPINEGQNLPELVLVYEDLFKQLKDIKFTILVSRGDEREAFLKWTMRYQFRGKPRELPGVSYFTFQDDGKVLTQQDYWDAANGVFAEVPGLGAAIRGLRKKIRVVPS